MAPGAMHHRSSASTSPISPATTSTPSSTSCRTPPQPGTAAGGGATSAPVCLVPSTAVSSLKGSSTPSHPLSRCTGSPRSRDKWWTRGPRHTTRGRSEATGMAYKRQFQSDFARFLRCRATELKHGGAMFLLCLGRPAAADPTDQGRVKLLYGTLFEDSWADLVREGLMDSETMLDSFNVPLYAPTLDEFREVVDADGAFRINRLEMVAGSPPVVDRPDDPGAVGRTVANNVRSFVGAHVGKALADDLFVRLQRRAEERARELMEEMRFPHVGCSLSLA